MTITEDDGTERQGFFLPADHPPVERRFVTIRTAMQMFGVKYDLLHDAILEDALPAIRPGRSWLIKPDDVEEFLYRRHAEREASGVI